MAYLTKADFTSKSVTSSLMLQPGGSVGAGVYVRSRKNLITSPNLIRRLGAVSGAMKANCSQPDACTRNTKLVGKMNAKGKVYRMCDPAEAASRLQGVYPLSLSKLFLSGYKTFISPKGTYFKSMHQRIDERERVIPLFYCKLS